MNQVQKELWRKYQEKFPNESLKKTAEKLNIQFSRLYRISKGQEMKLSEYISFQQHIYQDRPQNTRNNLLRFINEHFFSLDEKMALSLKKQIEYSINVKKFTSPYYLH